MSDSEITMLDITFWKDGAFATTGRLQHRVHVKSTSVWTPLAPSSGHSGHVHRSWPATQVARHRSLCSTALAKADAERAFVERLAAFGVVDGPWHCSARTLLRGAFLCVVCDGDFCFIRSHT